MNIKIEGLDQAISKLKGLEDKLAKQYVKDGLHAGANIVRDEVIRACPVGKRTPHLRDAIKVRDSRYNRDGKIAVLVQLGTGSYKGKSFYGAFVELGHLSGKRNTIKARKQVAAVPFMLTGAQRAERRATNAAVARIVELIENEK